MRGSVAKRSPPGPKPAVTTYYCDSILLPTVIVKKDEQDKIKTFSEDMLQKLRKDMNTTCIEITGPVVVVRELLHR